MYRLLINKSIYCLPACLHLHVLYVTTCTIDTRNHGLLWQLYGGGYDMWNMMIGSSQHQTLDSALRRPEYPGVIIWPVHFSYFQNSGLGWEMDQSVSWFRPFYIQLFIMPITMLRGESIKLLLCYVMLHVADLTRKGCSVEHVSPRQQCILWSHHPKCHSHSNTC